MKTIFQAGAMALALTFFSGAVIAEEPTWTVNFKDSDIQEVIKFVADATGKTVVIDPLVKGKVKVISTDPLNQQQLYDLFLSVLDIHGFTALQNGEVVRIIPSKEARSTPMPLSDRVETSNAGYITQVIPLHNVSANKVLPVLRPLVPQQSHLAAYEAGNAIVIADTAANVARIRSLIARIDQASVVETELVKLKYAQADELINVLNQLNKQEAGQAGAGQKQQMVADKRTNAVLIRGDDLARQEMKTLIRRLDQPGPQTGNVRVVYLEYANASSVAKSLTNVIQNMHGSGGAAKGGSATATRATVEADEDTNALLITAEGDMLESLLQVVKRLDIRRAQVLVEAIIVELEDTQGRDLGIEWLFQNDSGAFGSSAQSPSTLKGVASSALSDDANSQGGLADALTSITGQTLGVGRVTDSLSFSVLINALEANTNANILSTPNLLTMDNHPAAITVGQSVPFVTGQFTNTGDSTNPQNPFQTIERESIGINLQVTPHINEGNTVLLEVVQEVSSLTNTILSDVVTNERKIDTQILVDDGETVVLGGLIKDDLQDVEQRVPVLGSIPLLGRLFRSTSTELRKTNLLVFIRAKIIRDGKELVGATAEKYRYIREQQQQFQEDSNNWLGKDVVPVLPEWQAQAQVQAEAPAAPATDESADDEDEGDE